MAGPDLEQIPFVKECAKDMCELKDGEAACRFDDPQIDEEIKQDLLKEVPQLLQLLVSTNSANTINFGLSQEILLHQYELIIKRELFNRGVKKCDSSYLESENIKLLCQRIEAGDNDVTNLVQLFSQCVQCEIQWFGGRIDDKEARHFLLFLLLKAMSKKQHNCAALRNIPYNYYIEIEEALAGEVLEVPIGAVISYDPLFCLPPGKNYYI